MRSALPYASAGTRAGETCPRPNRVYTNPNPQSPRCCPQLRDLDKQLKVLEKFKFLKELNLKGNP